MWKQFQPKIILLSKVQNNEEKQIPEELYIKLKDFKYKQLSSK